MERASSVYQPSSAAAGSPLEPESSGSSEPEPSGSSFRHELLIHAGDEEFLEGALAFVTAALAAGEPLLVAVRSSRVGALRAALGDRGERVLFADMHTLGRNPARLIPAWRQFLVEFAPDHRGARALAEPIWPGRSQAEVGECQRHEALLNLAFGAGQAWHLLCPYDLEVVDEQTLAAALAAHPNICRRTRSERNPAFDGGSQAPCPFEGSLPDPLGEPEVLHFKGETLRELRIFVSQRAEPLLASEAAEHLLVAVNEVASNSVRHGGGEGTLRMWSEDGALVCEVADRGRICEPLLGRIHPSPEQQSGRGLWLVNHLCDLVQIRTTPAGSVVRMRMRLR